jgi:hypothetical protein
MMIFLRGKLLDFIVLDKTYAIPVNIHTLMVTDVGAKARYEANAKAVDHLVRSLCDPEFERVLHLNLAWQIWEKLLVAHGGDKHVKARLFVSYRMQYENFTQHPGEDIDAMFQRFTAIVNNMKANVEDFSYTEHDQALKLLHVLDPNVWGAKVDAIKESGQYLTIELDDLFSKLKSAVVDRKLQSKLEGSTDHSLALENKYKMSEYKAHPRREDKYSSKGKHFSKSKIKDKDKRRPSKSGYKKDKARSMVAGASDIDSSSSDA